MEENKSKLSYILLIAASALSIGFLFLPLAIYREGSNVVNADIITLSKYFFGVIKDFVVDFGDLETSSEKIISAILTLTMATTLLLPVAIAIKSLVTIIVSAIAIPSKNLNDFYPVKALRSTIILQVVYLMFLSWFEYYLQQESAHFDWILGKMYPHVGSLVPLAVNVVLVIVIQVMQYQALKGEPEAKSKTALYFSIFGLMAGLALCFAIFMPIGKAVQSEYTLYYRHDVIFYYFIIYIDAYLDLGMQVQTEIRFCGIMTLIYFIVAFVNIEYIAARLVAIGKEPVMAASAIKTGAANVVFGVLTYVVWYLFLERPYDKSFSGVSTAKLASGSLLMIIVGALLMFAGIVAAILLKNKASDVKNLE